MAAEIEPDAGATGLTRGAGFGRGGGTESLAERREAAQRRLSSSVRAAELVDCGLRAFDEAMTEHGLRDPDQSLRATVRATLTLAYATPGYDITLVPAPGVIAVRVRHTAFGPEAELLELATPASSATPPAATDRDWVHAPDLVDEDALMVSGGEQAASPWWTGDHVAP